jgi:hypothetical protein
MDSVEKNGRIGVIDSSSSSGNAGNNFPWDTGTQLFVNLTTKDSALVTFTAKAGDWTSGDPEVDWGFSLGAYDFTRQLAPLQYSSDFGAIQSSYPVFNLLSGSGNLTEIIVNGPSSSRLCQDYSISIAGSNLQLVMGFYVWAEGDAVTDSLSFTLGTEYWLGSKNTTCTVQLGNYGNGATKKTLNSISENQLGVIKWAATKRGQTEKQT